MKTATITRLGEASHDSPILNAEDEAAYVPSTANWRGGVIPEDLLLFEKCGPQKKLFFSPAETRAAIVTCGGLCPGLNNVIRSVTRELVRGYGVRSVLGIRGGYRGLDPAQGKAPMELTDDVVEDIHKEGGTLLGTSRGPVEVSVAVKYLMDLGVDILFTVGGDGTQRGGNAIYEEARRQGRSLAVVGIPKTIDNDVKYVSRTFGFGTAVDEAVRVINSAHTEARSVDNGVSVVKLMGRHAGFIAAAASVASQDVNFCLVPEVPFALEGVSGLCQALERRLAAKDHAVVVVAEGAGQDLLEVTSTRDASGNKKLQDIGLHLRDALNAHFKSRGIEMTMRYFDPSYQIRGCPANTEDALICDRMGRHAVHAAMSGRTGLVVSFLHGHYVHVPIELIARSSKQVDVNGELWRAVLATTGQPARLM